MSTGVDCFTVFLNPVPGSTEPRIGPVSEEYNVPTCNLVAFPGHVFDGDGLVIHRVCVTITKKI